MAGVVAVLGDSGVRDPRFETVFHSGFFLYFNFFLEIFESMSLSLSIVAVLVYKRPPV